MSDGQTELSIDEPIKAGAVFSHDKKYRYKLWRIWDIRLPRCGFIMLNPSKADAFILDATVKRCIGFAKRWGHGSLIVGNIFALKSTDPKELYKSSYPVGPDNDAALLDIVQTTDLVITAWGNHGKYRERGDIVLRTLLPSYSEKMAHIGHSKEGEPLHPLYLHRKARPIKYQVRRSEKGALEWSRR